MYLSVTGKISPQRHLWPKQIIFIDTLVILTIKRLKVVDRTEKSLITWSNYHHFIKPHYLNYLPNRYGELPNCLCARNQSCKCVQQLHHVWWHLWICATICICVFVSVCLTRLVNEITFDRYSNGSTSAKKTKKTTSVWADYDVSNLYVAEEEETDSLT